MSEWVDAGTVEQLEEPGSRGFDVAGVASGGAAFFVVRKDGEVHAFRNRCPHTGAPLEWQPDRFLDMDNSFIECAMHGALFRVGDGMCLRGPCAGQALQALPIRVKDGKIEVDVSALREETASAQ